MISIIKYTYRNKFQGGFLQNVALYDCWTKYRVSRDQRQDIINLIRNVLFPECEWDKIQSREVLENLYDVSLSDKVAGRMENRHYERNAI